LSGLRKNVWKGKKTLSTMDNPRIVTEAEWIEARKKLLVKEKGLMRQRDAVAAERQ